MNYGTASSEKRKIELLAPAKDLACGKDAILCGADAVYIGGRGFGARSEAGNPTEDIAELCRFAHFYGAKVYVALNTLVYETELADVRRLGDELVQTGVDAFIIQDLALTKMGWRIPLHASTQMDNRSAEQVKFELQCGMRRAILARELSLEQMAQIHKQVPQMDLEAFVHGALCVSYSGRCNASQHCFGRSANRGECAQFCRLAFNLEDAAGRVLVKNRHLLSLRDMNRSSSIEEMILAGISSFKIEGRLKGADYVRNVTAYYRREIDKVLLRHPNWERSSWGETQLTFEPNPQKTFNRGYTEYFLRGRTADVYSLQTPKAMGEPVGEVKSVQGNRVRVAGMSVFHNGDGLCYLDGQGQLQGFRVNRAENNLLHLPAPMPSLKPHTTLWRNHDEAFLQSVLRSPIERTLSLNLRLEDTPDGYKLTLRDEMGRTSEVVRKTEKIIARTPQQERQIAELSKLGGTGYRANHIEIAFQQNWFLPASELSALRREAVEKLPGALLATSESSEPVSALEKENSRVMCAPLVANSQARCVCQEHGVEYLETPYEFEPNPATSLMTCRHCIRFALGDCLKNRNKDRAAQLPRDLFLALPDGKRFRLQFNCNLCEMQVYATD